MRVVAGFTAEPGTFWIARDIDPPEQLEAMVFPDVDLSPSEHLFCGARTRTADGLLDI